VTPLFFDENVFAGANAALERELSLNRSKCHDSEEGRGRKSPLELGFLNAMKGKKNSLFFFGGGRVPATG